MSQFDFGDLESPLPGETFINGNLEPWRDALHSSHMGDDRPSYAVPGMLWIDNSETPWVAKVFQGSNDIIIGTLDPSTLVFTPSILPSAFGAAYAVLKMNAAGDGLEYGLVDTGNLEDEAVTALKADTSVNAIGNVTGATDIDLDNGRAQTATLTGNTTFSFLGPKATGSEDSFTLGLTTDASSTVTWPASVEWGGGEAPELVADDYHLFVFFTYDGGTTWYGFLAGSEFA